MNGVAPEAPLEAGGLQQINFNFGKLVENLAKMTPGEGGA